MKTIAVVGASLAGLRTAQALRAQGFDGRLVLIGDEVHQPYDRPPLSKAFLLGKEHVPLADDDELAELHAEWHLGVRAERLRVAELELSDGSVVGADGVVIATGGVPRPLGGALLLRTLDDATTLRGRLADGAERVVVVGAGFIGAEVASSCRQLGLGVTVVEALPAPLSRVLGDEMGTVCGQLHGDHGTVLITGVGVGEVRPTSVTLTDGRELPADVVVAGVGMRPATDWLAGSPVEVNDGVVCDAGGVTAIPRIVAVGDVARCAGVREEHWTSATEQASVAARNLLAGRRVSDHRRGGYVWSDQYGVRIQFAGRSSADVRIEEGSVEDRKFVATYHRGDTMIGVLAMSSARSFTRLRRNL